MTDCFPRLSVASTEPIQMANRLHKKNLLGSGAFYLDSAGGRARLQTLHWQRCFDSSSIESYDRTKAVPS